MAAQAHPARHSAWFTIGRWRENLNSGCLKEGGTSVREAHACGRQAGPRKRKRTQAHAGKPRGFVLPALLLSGESYRSSGSYRSFHFATATAALGAASQITRKPTLNAPRQEG